MSAVPAPFAPKPLPFATDALVSKGISKQTVELHYHKHHTGYATRLNDIAAKNPALKLAGKSAEQLTRTTSPGTVVFNMAAQIFNHDFYWASLSPSGGAFPKNSNIARQITSDFGSFKAFFEKFSAAAGGHFASGWAWLVFNVVTKRLEIVETHDADSPVSSSDSTKKLEPIFVCDVWEHAYYVDYRNDRAAYVKAFWRALNWDFAEKNLTQVLLRAKL